MWLSRKALRFFGLRIEFENVDTVGDAVYRWKAQYVLVEVVV